MIPVTIACRPVINEAYHERLTSLGIDPATPELNPAPAPGSEQGTCGRCGGEVWLGPRQQATLNKAVTGELGEYRVTIECLICAFLTAGDVRWVSLSGQ